MRLAVDAPRWEGVPIAIRAGKCMPVTATEVAVRFHPTPVDVFGVRDFLTGNMLRFRIWPESEVGLTLSRRSPGAGWYRRCRT